LIVDDEEFNLIVLDGLLKRLGLKKIDQARSGEVAIDMVKSENYDVVFIDNHLGQGLSGIQTVHLLKPLKPLTHFVIASGDSI
jgi:CheY-like chemotaxis protein